MKIPRAKLASLAAFAVIAAAAPARAADDIGDAAQDVVKLAGFVRWSGVFVSIFVILGASLVLRFLGGVMSRLALRFVDRRLTLQKIESIARFSVYILTGAVVVALSLQVNETVLTVVGGTLAVALGFAMRDLVASIIAGVIIMLDRPFQVGDRVKLADQYGDIISIGLRSVRMQTLDDNTVTIPNSKILTDVTSSGNYGALDMQVQIDLFVGADQDVELAERLVKEATLASPYVFLDKPLEVRIAHKLQMNVVVVHLRVHAYVVDTRYETFFATDVTKRALRAFAEHGVLPPAALERPMTRPPRAAARISAG